MEGLEFTSFTDTEKQKLEDLLKSGNAVGYDPGNFFGYCSYREIKEPSYLSRKFDEYQPRIYGCTYNYSIKYNNEVVGFLAIWNGVSPFGEDQLPDIDFWFIDTAKVNPEEAKKSIFTKLQKDFLGE